MLAITGITGQIGGGVGRLLLLDDVTDAVAFLRPAWFMENSAGNIACARNRGVIDSRLQPRYRAIPRVATADINRADRANPLIHPDFAGGHRGRRR